MKNPTSAENALRAAARSPTDNANPHKLANAGKYEITPLRNEVLTDANGIPLTQAKDENPLLAIAEPLAKIKTLAAALQEFGNRPTPNLRKEFDDALAKHRAAAKK